jgi:muramoyltetrapeptide carboxypeptidase
MATSSRLKSSTRAAPERLVRVARKLPEPATIGVCALSGRVDDQELARGAGYLEDLGHKVVIAPQTEQKWRYFAGTDEERVAGLHALLDDDSIDMVVAARGGYGLSRLLARIDWNRVAESGKIFVGFSDFTAFNMAAYACANLVTFHGPMLTSDFAAEDPDTFAQQHFWLALSRASHHVDGIHCDHGYSPRRIEGRLWGGNLALITHLVGTPYFPSIDDGILYVEDISEEPYAIERMFLQLLHAGVLGRQRAILLGDFTHCTPEKTKRYPYSMDEVLEALRSWLPIPVLTGLPFGHVARKLTLPFGADATLSIGGSGYNLRFAGHVR